MGMTTDSPRVSNSPRQAVSKLPVPALCNEVPKVTHAFFHGGHLRATSRDMRIGIWNVEGLTDAKVLELQHYMMDIGLDVLCLQKTHLVQ